MNRVDHILLLIRHPKDMAIAYPTVNWLYRKLQSQVTILLSRSNLDLSGNIEDQLDKLAKESNTSSNNLKIVQCEDLLSYLVQSNLNKQRTLCVVIASAKVQKSLAHLDTETIDLIEKLPFPILLLPKDHSPKPPWRSILVPMSGELRRDRALDFAIYLGNECHSPVNIVHVVDCHTPQKNHCSAIEKVCDEVHHELPEVLDDFISAASPFSNVQEKQIIRGFSLVLGKANEQIMHELKKRKADMIAVQWRGNFMKGRAEILKAMLEKLHLPILLVKPESFAVSLLKAGHRLAS